MKTAGAISRLLEQAGITTIFGNPGTTELPFLEHVGQRYILTPHDSIAVGAADGYAQVTRRPSVANLHAAPGLGNAMAFVDSARRNRSPVVLTVGQQDLRQLTQEPLLAGDFKAMTAGLVKYAFEVTRAQDVTSALRQALVRAATPPAGPVLLSLPMDVMEAESSMPETWRPPEAPTLGADAAGVAEALQASARPAIVAGYEVDATRAFSELHALADRLGAPIFAEPFASRAPVDARWPAFAGDLLPASPMIDSLLGEYDTVLLVGADLILYPFFPAPLLDDKTVLYVGGDGSVAAKLATHSALGPLPALLKDLTGRLPGGRTPFQRPRDFARANRVARSSQVMGGEYVLSRVHKAFPDHAVVDEAVSQTPTLKSLGFYRGEDTYFSSRSGQLGWALAASLGIALAGRPTVVVLGDGALLYTPQSLWTMARYDLPIKVVVLNNHGYAILRSYSKAYHPKIADADYLQLPKVDVLALAKAFGVEAESVGSAKDLDAALERLKARPGPGLLNVETDRTVPNLFS